MDVTLKGEKFQTNGQPPKVGEDAPSFTVKNLDDQDVKLSEYIGDVLIISTVPDIETSTCSRQTNKFNDEAKELTDTKVISISTNTLDQQSEWSQSKVLSSDILHDTDRTFAKDYGLYIDDLDKMARTVFVVNRKGQIVYREIVEEMSKDPDYEAALSAARHEEAELT
ncbi:thiol peroxidase [Alkalibacterium olivapovliticus]|uniref:Thiol peroxidase, atypical 2-Cys peroxiredoxin n=1 Tax=Alkalibacterium olivapovliticus TaxID=99907 RepID=A0A2T0WB50_9LACT|nr:redoxin domain-containing protein [Alkalibacterium olivapovliticus]PRY83928.1 thiol peroxidase, atypical 2-Cys peroxiredoxin [Alkalibacterium olivapovliticus]